jgi:hypothetical protein
VLLTYLACRLQVRRKCFSPTWPPPAPSSSAGRARSRPAHAAEAASHHQPRPWLPAPPVNSSSATEPSSFIPHGCWHRPHQQRNSDLISTGLRSTRRPHTISCSDPVLVRRCSLNWLRSIAEEQSPPAPQVAARHGGSRNR